MQDNVTGRTLDIDISEFFNALTRKGDISLAVIKFVRISQKNLQDFDEITQYLDKLNKNQICSTLVHYLSDFSTQIQSDYSVEQLKKNNKLYTRILDILLERAVKLGLSKNDYNSAIKNLEIKNISLAEKNYLLLNDRSNNKKFKYVFYTRDNTKIECESYEEALEKAVRMHHEGMFLIKLLKNKEELEEIKDYIDKEINDTRKSYFSIKESESKFNKFEKFKLELNDFQKQITFINKILENYDSFLKKNTFFNNYRFEFVDEVEKKLPRLDILMNGKSLTGKEIVSLGNYDFKLSCFKIQDNEVFEEYHVGQNINILSLEKDQFKLARLGHYNLNYLKYDLAECELVTKSAGSLKLNLVEGSVYQNNVNFLESYILKLEVKKNKYSSEKDRNKIEEKIKLLRDLSQMIFDRIYTTKTDLPIIKNKIADEVIKAEIKRINKQNDLVVTVVNEWKIAIRLDKKDSNAIIIGSHRNSFFKVANKYLPKFLKKETRTEKVIKKLLKSHSPIVLNTQSESEFCIKP